MSWNDIYGQDLAKAMFRAHLKGNRVSNAYLLAGPAGIGKRTLALEMAKALNCADKEVLPCDACQSCLQIRQGKHPDVHSLNSSGSSEQIRIDAVRHLIGRIALRPFSARYHMIIVDGAERMTEEAANSLLKSLEEPSLQTCFILLTSQPERCLSTIVSRCQMIRCQRLSRNIIEKILVSEQGCEGAQAKTVSQLAGGSIARALQLIKRWTTYERLINQFGHKEQSSLLEASLPEERSEVMELLDVMVSWLRDVAVISVGKPELVANEAAQESLEWHARRLMPDRCIETAWELMNLRESLDQFANPRLVAALAREHWLGLTNKEQALA